MPYTKLLNQLIDKSGLTVKEIAERCNEQGQPITASYISVLRREANGRVPSAEVSQALEAVLGAQKDALVLEGYLDGAPETLKQALRTMQGIVFEFALRAIDKAIPIGEIERENIRSQVEEMPLSQLVLEVCLQPLPMFDGNIMTSSEQSEDGQINVNMSANLDFPITDSSMQPVLPEGSKAKLKLQEEYRSGDIVMVMNMGGGDMLYRKLYDTKDGARMLVPLNPAFDVMEFDPGSMLIFGRVEAVVTQL